MNSTDIIDKLLDAFVNAMLANPCETTRQQVRDVLVERLPANPDPAMLQALQDSTAELWTRIHAGDF